MTNKTILLVEDNLDYQELIKIAFEESEIYHNLVVVHDGVEALDYLFAREKFANRNDNLMPALILMDLNMPRLNGIEVLREIRNYSQTKLLPVVIMSASKEPSDVVTSYSSGCNSYIRKPVDFMELQNVMKKLAWYWLNINEITPVLGIINE